MFFVKPRLDTLADELEVQFADTGFVVAVVAEKDIKSVNGKGIGFPVS